MSSWPRRLSLVPHSDPLLREHTPAAGSEPARGVGSVRTRSYGAGVPESEVVVRPVDPPELPVLERLWSLFQHDLSEFRGGLPDADGTFRQDRLHLAMNDPAWASYLFWIQGRPVGLALVRALDQPVRVLNAFFVARGARRAGIGSRAVREVLLRHPGSWEVPFQDDNETAVHFWRRTARAIAGDDWTEERRAVPARPDLPPDVWISFATAGTAA